MRVQQIFLKAGHHISSILSRRFLCDFFLIICLICMNWLEKCS